MCESLSLVSVAWVTGYRQVPCVVLTFRPYSVAVPVYPAIRRAAFDSTYCTVMQIAVHRRIGVTNVSPPLATVWKSIGIIGRTRRAVPRAAGHATHKIIVDTGEEFLLMLHGRPFLRVSC